MIGGVIADGGYALLDTAEFGLFRFLAIELSKLQHGHMPVLCSL